MTGPILRCPLQEHMEAHIRGLSDQQLVECLRSALTGASRMEQLCTMSIVKGYLTPDAAATAQDMVDVHKCFIRPVLDDHLLQVLKNHSTGDYEIVSDTNLGDRIVAYCLVDLFITIAGSRLPKPSGGKETHLPVIATMTMKRLCGACGRDGLQLCGRCKKVWYCNAACQKAHWKESHKQECCA